MIYKEFDLDIELNKLIKCLDLELEKLNHLEIEPIEWLELSDYKAS